MPYTKNKSRKDKVDVILAPNYLIEYSVASFSQNFQKMGPPARYSPHTPIRTRTFEPKLFRCLQNLHSEQSISMAHLISNSTEMIVLGLPRPIVLPYEH